MAGDPTFPLYASGDLVYTGSLYNKLLALEVVSYEHVRTEKAARLNLPEGPRVGFIAQQVAEVLPELVGELVHAAGCRPPGAQRSPLVALATRERLLF